MSSYLSNILSAAAKDLRDCGAGFAVVGGMAVGARAQVRYTRDVDVAMLVRDDEQAMEVGGYLVRYGYRTWQELDQKSAGRLATLRMISPHAPKDLDPADVPLLDIMFAVCGIEAELIAAATATELLPGVILPTARIPHLIAMKLLSESDKRLQDRLDLQALLEAATDADLAQVGPLLDLIAQRDFSGGKNLHAAFARFRSQE